MKIKSLITLLVFWNILFSLQAQKQIQGTILSSSGEPLSDVLVVDCEDSSNSTYSKKDGTFLFVADDCNYISVNNTTSEIKILEVPFDGNVGTIIMDNNHSIIDMGNNQTSLLRSTQSSVLIKANDIINNSSFSVKDALVGISPFSIRGDKYNSLLIVDGFPRSWDYLSKQSIESITILKDAAGKALWGARGANGVLLVTTKRGKLNAKEFGVEYSHGTGFLTNVPKMVDAETYAKSINEALYYDGLPMRYSPDEIDLFSSGKGDADLYPNVNWLKEGLRKNTHNNQLNIRFRGGGNNIRYFSSTDYKNNFGVINSSIANSDSRYSSQIRSYELSTQMNLDVILTKNTQAKLNMLGFLSENMGPSKNNVDVFESLVNVPSASFPLYTKNGYWGANNIYNLNPIADIVALGFSKTNQRLLQADFTLQQNFSKILQGLSAEIGIAYDNSVSYYETQTKSYAYEVNEIANNTKSSTVYGNESNLEYQSSLADQFMQSGLKFKVLYDKVLGNFHHINLSGIYGQESLVLFGRNNSRKRQYVLGSFGYNFQDRYLFDFVLNYYGTSVLPKGKQFTPYPALSMGWILSNESFFNVKAVNLMKFRFSAGQSGLDILPYELDKQFWESGSVYYFRDNNNAQWGTKEGPLPSSIIKNERLSEINIGLDGGFFDKITLNLDAFYKRRDNMKVSGSATYSSALGIEVPNVFEGVTDTKGGEISIRWDEKRKNYHFYTQGNITFARTKIVENNEGFQPFDYLYKKGRPLGQFYGLEAIGYFNNWDEINDSPRQMFSDVRPGDIKYKDQNNDDKIDQFDVIARGYSTYLPEIYFGLKLGFSYKNWGIDMIWQGITNYSIELNTTSVYWPLRNNTNLSYWYLNDKVRWTEETKHNANVPRLTTLDNSNNFRSSTQWLEDGSYLSLRNVNLYYNLPATSLSKYGINEFQIYIRGNNLLLFDKVRYLTSENLNINYPNLKTVYLGLSVKF